MHLQLTKNLKGQEKVFTEIILRITPVEKIYLLAIRQQQQLTESIFQYNTLSSNSIGHCYLLVLVNKNSPYTHHDLQDRIENNCRNFIPVTVLVLTIQQFVNNLNEGGAFAATVLANAELLHGVNDFTIPQNKDLQQTDKKQENKEHWTQAYNQVNEFIEGAKLYLIRRQNKMALYMLHQATTLLLSIIFKKKAGLHINTHNIDKLLRYCSLITDKIPGFFPRNNDKEERLFQLLQKAGTGTTYKQDFAVSKDDIEILLQRIKCLQSIYLSGH